MVDKYDTFCLGIFISGLKPSIENNLFIENSFNYIPQCGHKNCSLFLSMKPELILTYSNKNSNLSHELNYLVANLCFPLGIKICFETPGENIKDKKNVFKSHNIYYNVIKNAKDEIFYIATLQYFIKMDIKDFKDKYEIDLISYYSHLNNSEKKDNNIKKLISLIDKLSESHIIYVPESISLLSKYPFYYPMKICLNSIMSLQSLEEKNNLINHLINEVPIPKKLNQIHFYIPLYKIPIILNHSFNIFKGLSMLDNSEINFFIDNLSISQLNSKLLLEYISIDNIIILFQLLLLEQQILIINNNYQILSEIIIILISLIYPLTWTNPFLPILSLNTVQFLQTPVPYIMGLDEFLLNYAYNAKNIYVGKEIIMYNLMTKNFILSRNKKKASKRDIMHEFKLNFFPEKIENFMSFELKKLKIIMESNKINDINLDMKIRLVFIKTMILLIGDYNNYTIYKNDDDMPLFNKEAFIESHKEKQIKLFLGQMTKTQLFNQFLLNEKELYFHNYNKANNNINNMNNEDNNEEKLNNNNYIDTSYFKKMIKQYPEFINNEEIRKSSLDLDSDLNLNNNKNLYNSYQNIKRSKSNKNLKLNFINKKDIFSSNTFDKTPIVIEEKKLAIDFNKINSPDIINLTKSHNFNLPLKFNNNINNINNDLSIKKTVTNKYNNILIKKVNKIKKYLLYPYFLPKITKKELNLLNQKIISDQISIYNKNYNYQLNNKNLNSKIYILPKTLIYNFSLISHKNYYIINQNNNINKNNTDEGVRKNLTEKNLNNNTYSTNNENENCETLKSKKISNTDTKKKNETKKLKNKKRKSSQK